MNNLIFEQLKKCKTCVLPSYTIEDEKLFIHKQDSVVHQSFPFQIGHYYQIKLADYIINEPQSFTLSSNWNKGSKPINPNMIVCIDQILGKMIYIKGTYVDLPNIWEGWVPSKSIQLIKEVT